MIALRVEVWPHGDSDDRMPLARVEIANRGQVQPVSDYEVVLRPYNTVPGPPATVYGHRRADGWLPLARAALRALDPNGGFYTAPTATIPAAVLPALDLAPYTSRACQTARAILASDPAALAAHLAEIRMGQEEWAGEFFLSCRETEKWTGLACQDPQHHPAVTGPATGSGRPMLAPGSHPKAVGDATMAADMCPRCKGDNSEAWGLCMACEEQP